MKRLALLACAALPVLAEPRLVYSKSFPGSVPPWVEITLTRDGKAVYKEAPDDDQPLKFEMSKEETEEIYALAEKLERFKNPLESGLKVANMGMKTFRWDDGGASQEQKFNYSQDENARLLLDWFEKMTESEQLYIAVERSVRYDKLGANRALLQLQAAMEKGRLAGGEQFLPMLDRVIKNESFLNMARERASALAEMIRNPKPKEQKAAQ
jgi:hypothetical protein